MPCSIPSIPLANIDELNELWEADERLPTLSSRREWSIARNLHPTAVNEWWWARRRQARDRGVGLSCENYHLSVGNPPDTVLIKIEPVDEDLPISPDASRCSSPSNDTLSVSHDLSSEDCNLSSQLLFSEKSEPGSPQTSLAPSSDQNDSKNMDICAHTRNEDLVLVTEALPSCGLHLPPELLQIHQPPAASFTEDTSEDDEVMLVDESSILRPLRSWQRKLWSTSTSIPQHSESVSLSCYSFLSLDGKTFTPNGSYSTQAADSEDHNIHIIKTTTQPYEFPLLSEWSDSDYLPHLPPTEAEPIESESPPECPLFASTHTWYRRHVDSPQYDTIIDTDLELDTDTLEYHAFSKHLYLQWTGDEGWLMRKELYVP
ncbi:hypothetical protein C8R41DRAFT_984241 [Lentinula lateritia]|uniref:Uncharacterized protein n=1 Tax=Lentinula lateritia TaxID=40482 RepID=A0ABQ8V2E8_9AGAR|nr:hypothetical protein C8R41DRAFT_984241 [Lentinula lateritia]